MKLSPRERSVLLHYHLRANDPAKDIARQCGQREDTVRNIIRRLRQRNIITWYPFINATALGYAEHEILFNLATTAPNRRKIIEELCTYPQVSVVTELGGDFQFSVVLFSQTPGELVQVIDQFSQSFGEYIYDKVIVQCTQLALYPRGYLSPEHKVKSAIERDSRVNQYVVDELDHRILSGLHHIPHESFRDLARRLDIPRATFLARIKRLEEREVIVGYAYGVTTTPIGVLPFRLLVYTRCLNQHLREKFLKHCHRDLNIYGVYETIGEFDFELFIEIERLEELPQVTQRLRSAFPDEITSIRPMAEVTYHKLDYYPFESPDRELAYASG